MCLQSQSFSERVIERNWSDPISVAAALIIGFGNKKSRLSADKEWPIKSIAQLLDNWTNGLLERMQCESTQQCPSPSGAHFAQRVFVTAMALIYYSKPNAKSWKSWKCCAQCFSRDFSQCIIPFPHSLSFGQSVPIIQSIYLLILLLSANLVKKPSIIYRERFHYLGQSPFALLSLINYPQLVSSRLAVSIITLHYCAPIIV